MTDEIRISAEILDNKNKNNVCCRFCHSLILKPLQAVYLESEFKLPSIHQKNNHDAQNIQAELHRHFWVVNDMFTFENIGFSNTVGNHKFLTCADCDMGPVGYHDITSKKCFIALERVNHESAPSSKAANDLEKLVVNN